MNKNQYAVKIFEKMMSKIKKRAIVLGAGGFIGSHLVNFLKKESYWVKGVDLKKPEFSKTGADEFVIGDLRDPVFVKKIFNQKFDEVYQLAADMGGAGYVFTGNNDADIMSNSVIINLNVLKNAVKSNSKKVFFSSSACIYPGHNQISAKSPKLSEESAYPAYPDSEYGWEKLFSERIYLAFHRNYDLDVRIARFHNVFGPEGTWKGGKEKAPAALCRKIAEAKDGGKIEIWGDGKQTRSFLYIDECLKGIRRLMNSDFTDPINIGSEEMVTLNKLAEVIMEIANKELTIKHIPGPVGVRGRKSDNRLIRKKLNWEPKEPLRRGLEKTYSWIDLQVKSQSE